MMGEPEMATVQTAQSSSRKPLRLWPGVVIVALQWLLRFVIPEIVPEDLAPQAMLYGIFGALLCAVALLLWWLFFSRAPWLERLGVLAVMVVAMVATRFALHRSIAEGAMGFMFPIYVTPVACLALVVWAMATRNATARKRWVTLVAVMLIACGGWALFRTDGMTGSAGAELRWRWSKTSEELLLAQSADEPTARPPGAPVVAAEAEWPGFRGLGRDSVIPDIQIETDWTASPPRELWRRPIGPGWSSFAVLGDRVFTQEQRGGEEVVSCYHARTGELIWRHGDAARFWESNAGAGPRATPTLHEGRVYSLGGTGIVNALAAADGDLVWSRNAAADTGAQTPEWGFSGSPVVVDDVVIVAASGTLIGYDIATGEPRWTGPKSGTSYSSPHLATIGGVPQVLLLRQEGLISVSPAAGEVLWEHAWPGYPIVQPAMTAEGDILISVSDRSGTRRLSVESVAGGWAVEEEWTSIRLKPYFNDFVVHEGHAYGFDGSILACMSLLDGERVWKGGRYGNGQLVLLAEQDLLLVLSEQGELALVSATPDGFTELARFPAIAGKTWNHPVLIGDYLLVRNGQEMAAFRLALPSG
jgi:outer membrane protein assembly factor BamB